MVPIHNKNSDSVNCQHLENRRKIFVIFFGYIIYVYNKKSLIPLFTELIGEFDLSEQDVGMFFFGL